MNIEKIAKNVFAKNDTTMNQSLAFLKKELKKAKNKQSTKDVFRAIRLLMGLTQEEFADLLEVTSKSISRWECGESIPQLSVSQYCLLAYELKKNNIDFFNLNCYKLTGYPEELKIIHLTPATTYPVVAFDAISDSENLT
jgi:transcriptional regulator with XRE-family HTH domain